MNEDYKIIDDIIPLTYQNHIESLIENTNEFPWFFSSSINQNPDNSIFTDKNTTDAPGLGHIIIHPETQKPHSPLYPYVLPILFFLEEKTGIKIKNILRSRVRRTVQYPGHTLEKYTPAHVDLAQSVDYKSLVYYVDESDGDTVLFDKEYDSEKGDTVLYNNDRKQIVRVAPKKGRALLFKGKIFHAGNCPVDFKKRTVINFDFTVKET
jgi:hypothetical protein